MRKRPTFLGRGFMGRSFLGWTPEGGPSPPAPIVVPTDEMVNWIADRIGMGFLFNRLPQSASEFPLFTYAIVGGFTHTDLGGSIGLRRFDIQFDCWSRDASQVLLGQEKLFRLLANYRGPMGKVFCQVALAGQPRSTYFPDEANSDAGFYRASSDWKITVNC